MGRAGPRVDRVRLGHDFDGQKYQNYPVRDLPDFRWNYWGDAYNSLLLVKRKFDPTNVFHFEQSISPYPDDLTIRRSTVPFMYSEPTIEHEPYSTSFLEGGK